MKSYKNKIIDPQLEKKINELNFNIKLLTPGEWQNPKTENAKTLKHTIIKLQDEINTKLQNCPDTEAVKYLTPKQVAIFLESWRLKHKA